MQFGDHVALPLCIGYLKTVGTSLGHEFLNLTCLSDVLVQLELGIKLPMGVFFILTTVWQLWKLIHILVVLRREGKCVFRAESVFVPHLKNIFGEYWITAVLGFALTIRQLGVVRFLFRRIGRPTFHLRVSDVCKIILMLLFLWRVVACVTFFLGNLNYAFIRSSNILEIAFQKHIILSFNDANDVHFDLPLRVGNVLVYF